MCMLQILVACLKVLGKTPVGSGDTKRIYLGAGWVKGSFQILYFTSANILFTLPSLWYGSCDRALESQEAK